MDGLSTFFFPGFSTVPGHVPGLPTVVTVSPKLAVVAFSCQGDAITGFILLYRKPVLPFTVNNHIQCGKQCLG